MNLEGMDVDQVDSLARRMDTHTRTLESIAAVLGGLAAELSHLWRGPAAATFQHDCETLHRPAITAAASAISDLHQHLVANLAQQVRASAADGGPGGPVTAGSLGGGGGSWTPDRAWNDLVNGTKIFGTATLPFAIAEVLGKSGPLFDVLDKVGYVGIAVGAVSTLDDARQASHDLDDRRYGAAANDFVDAVSDGLKTVPGPLAPATYFAGVDLTLLHKIANLNWTDTPNPLSASQFMQYYWPELKQMGTGAYWEQAAEVYWSAM
jgi:uncharacterized protein YukE